MKSTHCRGDAPAKFQMSRVYMNFSSFFRKENNSTAAAAQDRQMPGERARVEYGLEALSHEDIQRQLQASCKTVQGLRALTVIFPESVMPAPQSKYCVRCHKNYDERYPDQKVCRVEHPFDFCHTEWDGSKISHKTKTS